MKQKSLSSWLCLITYGVALCILAIFALAIPDYGMSIVAKNPEFESWYLPWLIFVEISGIPCLIALIPSYRIFRKIGCDCSFSVDNARRLSLISVLAAADGAYIFVGNVVFLLLEMSHPGVLLLSFIAVFGAVSISVATAALSHLVRKAAELQEQSDLTI